MFKFFIENDLILGDHYGFKSVDSCINQLLSGVFVDISKTFEKIWHDHTYFYMAS